MRDPEYDRFGPWILEITEEDPIPRIFESHVNLEDAVSAFKVPRPEERRNLKSGMDLYDYVVAFFPSYLTILERIGNTVKRTDIQFDAVFAVEHLEDLLDGRLRIYTQTNVFEIPYNTVSADIINDAALTIRNGYRSHILGNRVLLNAPDYSVNDENLSFYFAALLKRIMDQDGVGDDPLRTIGIQPEKRVSKLEEGWWKRLLYGALDVKLLESMHFLDSLELRIVDRGRNWKFRWQVVMGKNTYYLPIHRIDSVEISTTKITGEALLIAIQTGVHRHEVVLLADNPLVDVYRGLNR